MKDVEAKNRKSWPFENTHGDVSRWYYMPWNRSEDLTVRMI
jgi:hypothetical protein